MIAPMHISRSPAGFKSHRQGDPIRAVVLSDAAPERNGVGSYYRDLVTHLRAHGVRMEMLPAKATRYFRTRGLSFRMPGDATQELHMPHIPRVARRFRKGRQNVIIAPTVGPFGLLALALARRYRTRLIVGHHTSCDKLAHLYWSGSRARISRRYLMTASQWLIRSADVVVVNSEEMAEEARRFGARHVQCVGTMVAPPFIQRALPAPPRRVGTVLFAGRLAAEKNIESILEAAAVLPGMQFRIAGDGPLRVPLTQRARRLPNVEMLGWLDRQALLEEVDQTDMLVLPSHIESFGSVALEGLARGRLVLVSEACGILAWPTLAPGLFRMGRDEPLADALQRVSASDADEFMRISQVGRDATHAMNEHTLAQWLQLLRGDLVPA
jgi:glycosyltransferase involved in cell wall biosynthesis